LVCRDRVGAAREPHDCWNGEPSESSEHLMFKDSRTTSKVSGAKLAATGRARPLCD
jgi:hypothetical protein